MGVTIHYRGTLDDIGQVEAMEDRVMDLVFSLGGRATIWRSYSAGGDPSRVVRGLIIDLEPGQDTFSLLVSPEGHLMPLFQIKDAESAPFDEPPYCFVKTQFGSVQGHVAIVHILDALGQQYCSNLTILDESEYHETRDIDKLAQKMRFLRTAISTMAEGLREHGLNKEAAEDPNILATRIERIARLVQQKLLAAPDPPDFPADADEVSEEDDGWREPSLEEEVKIMDELRRKNDLRCERMNRRIAEATASGLSVEEAFEVAMREEGFSIPNRDASDQSGEKPEIATSDEPWSESLPQHPFDSDGGLERGETHAAVEQAQAFLSTAIDLVDRASTRSSFASILTRASMDIVGGLVQATSDGMDNNLDRALAITQLKRALTGHAYARGALFGLRREEVITTAHSQELHQQLKPILTTIHELMEAAWA
ncbi:hypothetical protein [Stieleria varia]|uniref:Uncharacterized protein n=1 Tax=Stieleria varia TaxID=2528005 RepID=A0A5C6A877_9BACT|nr:hypothetical protein [Stieleria varia]TWT94503.1 hypothetical protein Pla52n_53240 [Stieleria varia]